MDLTKITKPALKIKRRDKMDLSKITKSVPLPPRVLIYSQPKMGKSTWASQAPSPIFFDIEQGLGALDVPAIPVESVSDVLEGLKALWEQDHEFKTVVVDSLDWLGPLVADSVCEAHKVKSIEKVGAFGAGYAETDKVWKQILEGLDYLRRKKGMTVILIAHATIKTATPTDGEPYDYAAIKLQARSAALVQEWCDVIGYAHQPHTIKKAVDDPNAKKPKVLSTRPLMAGDRALSVGHNPAYVTGNRYGLPDELPLDWAAFQEALNNK